MTAPATEPPPEQQPQPPSTGGSLAPVILAVLATYLASKATVSGPWYSVSRALDVMGIGGGVIESVARQALAEMARKAPGKTGNELWAHADKAVEKALETGVKNLVTIARESPAPPEDAGRSPVPVLPKRNLSTREAEALAAEMLPGDKAERIGDDLTRLIGNTAQAQAALLAGWGGTWRSQRDARVRASHRRLDGTTVAAGELFRTVEGIKLRYPHDPEAPLGERAGCRCWMDWSRSKK